MTDKRKGCGKLTRVAGTNGGKMPCGGSLTDLAGNVTIELCAVCRNAETFARFAAQFPIGCRVRYTAGYRQRFAIPSRDVFTVAWLKDRDGMVPEMGLQKDGRIVSAILAWNMERAE